MFLFETLEWMCGNNNATKKSEPVFENKSDFYSKQFSNFLIDSKKKV